MNESFEKIKNDFMRRGDMEKAKILQTLNKRLMPTQIQRIRRNDKTVLMEMVLPSWLTWDLLKQWVEENSEQESGKLCALCSNVKDVGVKFNEKFICEGCFKEIKNIQENRQQ